MVVLVAYQHVVNTFHKYYYILFHLIVVYVYLSMIYTDICIQ